MRILHLSDLHFGFDKDKTQEDKRNNYIDTLYDKITEVSKKNAIDYIFITGDIAWKAKDTDYQLASPFIKKVMEIVDVSADKVFLCPGNHDVNREVLEETEVPVDQERADELLKYERLDKLSGRFSEYITYCEDENFPKFSLKDKDNYLIGMNECEDFNIICINTSWYAKNDEVQNDMWVGNNFIENIIAEKKINSEKPVITLMHHPKRFLHKQETSNHISKVNTLKKIQHLSDMILYGHTHEIESDHEIVNDALILGAGAVYEGNLYRNNFYVYDLSNITAKTIEKELYSYDNGKWLDPQTKTISYGNIKAKTSCSTVSECNIQDELKNIGVDAVNIGKNDLLKPGVIIWPVVPRVNITHIHQAQIELMKLLSNQGWKVNVIISDCGSNASIITPDQHTRFRSKIRSYLKEKNIAFEDHLLSDFFKPKSEHADSVLNYFIRISNKINKSELEALKNKEYDEDRITENNELPVLDYILPLLQMAVVCYLAEEIHINESDILKSVTIAGKDEGNQWDYITDDIANHSMGVLLIPILKDNIEHNSWQGKISQYTSPTKLQNDLKKGNFAFWCYSMFIELPRICGETLEYKIDSEDYKKWDKKQFTLPDYVDIKKLTETIWKTIRKVI